MRLRDARGRAISIEGLWSIAFGTAAASDPANLYFTAGANDESDGVFGFLQSVPAKDHDRDDH